MEVSWWEISTLFVDRMDWTTDFQYFGNSNPNPFQLANSLYPKARYQSLMKRLLASDFKLPVPATFTRQFFEPKRIDKLCDWSVQLYLLLAPNLVKRTYARDSGTSFELRRPTPSAEEHGGLVSSQWPVFPADLWPLPRGGSGHAACVRLHQPCSRISGSELFWWLWRGLPGWATSRCGHPLLPLNSRVTQTLQGRWLLHVITM